MPLIDEGHSGQNSKLKQDEFPNIEWVNTIQDFSIRRLIEILGKIKDFQSFSGRSGKPQSLQRKITTLCDPLRLIFFAMTH